MNENFWHKNLVDGKWHRMTLDEQMGNIGSEVDRSLKWHRKGDIQKRDDAVARALELFSLSMTDPKNVATHGYEIARAKEVFLDYIFGDQQYGYTEQDFENYYMFFALRARKTPAL